MRFRCTASALIDGLQTTTKALPGRTPNEILEGVLIETELNDVILTCSDERITIVTRIEADIDEEGRGVVPGKLFNEVVRRLSEGDIDIDMNDRFMFTVRGSGSRACSSSSRATWRCSSRRRTASRLWGVRRRRRRGARRS